MKKNKTTIIENKYISELILVEKKIFIDDDLFINNKDTSYHSINVTLPLLRKIYPVNIINIKEIATILIFNNQLKLKGYSTLSIGTEHTCYMDASQIFKICLKSTNSSFMLVHNHTSGNIRPSEADLNIFKKLKEGSEILNLRFVDNIILTENDYYSFEQNGFF